MKVLLSSVGNPDFGQNPNEQLWGAEGNRVVDIKTFEDAVVECILFINNNDLGGGNWDGGDITDNGKLIAYVSYNGRVWEVEEGKGKWSGRGKEIEIDKESLFKRLRM
jgi:hypothetical protein